MSGMPAIDLKACGHCGIGEIGAEESCPWCGHTATGQHPVFLPWRGGFWQRFARLPGVRASARRNPLALGAVAGGYAGLLMGLIALVTPLSAMSTGGFFLEGQWWWYLAPDQLRHPLAAMTRGILLGIAVILLGVGSERRAPGHIGSRFAFTGAVLGAVTVGLLAILERASMEGVALAAAGGAFTGAAVHQSLSQWRPRAPVPTDDAGETSSAHSP